MTGKIPSVTPALAAHRKGNLRELWNFDTKKAPPNPSSFNYIGKYLFNHINWYS